MRSPKSPTPRWYSTVCKDRRRWRLRCSTWSASSDTVIRALPRTLLDVRFVEHPVRREPEAEERQHGDDRKQHPRHGCRVAHLEALERALIEVEGVEQRGVERRTTRDEERLREHLEARDGLHDQVEEDDRREERQRDPQEL